MADTYTSSVNRVLSPLGQTLVTLSAGNTRNLLSEASQLTLSRRADALALLNRLNQLNPTVGAQFQLKEDVLSELRLRFITTRDASPRPEPPEMSSFIIISYCWHYPQWPLAPAATPVAPGWEVSQTMVDATMDLRESSREGVWLDKLSIDQSADREKQVNIGAMDIIYRSARRVIILLEDVQLKKEEEDAARTYARIFEEMCVRVREENLEGAAKLDFVEKYVPAQEDASADKEALLADIRLFAMRILSARWFSRAWCAHESRVSPHPKVNNPLILCYGHDGRVVTFEYRCVHFIASYLEQQSSGDEFGLYGTSFSQLQQKCWLIQRLLPQATQSLSIMHHICSIAESGCLKKEDLISIALNTSSTPLVFMGHLKTVQEAVWIFALVALATGDLVPLIMDGNRLRLGRASLSWLPLPTDGVFNNTSPIVLPDSISAATGEYIELDFIVFPCLPRKPSPESGDIVYKIFEENKLFDLAQTASDGVQKNMDLLRRETIRAKGDDGLLKNSLVAWVSHALDCGLGWTAGFPDRMVRETQGEGWVHGVLGQSTNDRLDKAARSLLDHFIQNGAVVTALGSEADVLHKLTRFLTCILDPGFSLLATTGPRRLPYGPDDYIFTPSTSNRSWIALPTSLAHLPMWESRAWIVEPFDPVNDPPEDPSSHLPYLGVDDDGETRVRYPVLSSDFEDKRRGRLLTGTWKLRKQVTIMGPRPLVKPTELQADGEGILLLKKQRLYGAEDYDWTAMGVVAKEFQARQEATQGDPKQGTSGPAPMGIQSLFDCLTVIKRLFS